MNAINQESIQRFLSTDKEDSRIWWTKSFPLLILSRIFYVITKHRSSKWNTSKRWPHIYVGHGLLAYEVINQPNCHKKSATKVIVVKTVVFSKSCTKMAIYVFSLWWEPNERRIFHKGCSKFKHWLHKILIVYKVDTKMSLAWTVQRYKIPFLTQLNIQLHIQQFIH